MSDVVGADDLFALLNATPVLVPSDLDNSSTTDNNWQTLSNKDDIVQSVPVVILDDGQIALQSSNGQYYLLAGVNGGDEFIVPDFVNATADLSNVLQEATTEGADSILTDEVDVVNVDPSDKPTLHDDKTNSENTWVDFEKLKDFNSGLAAFRCLTCQFVTHDQQDISSHPHKDFILAESKHIPEKENPVEELSSDKDVQDKFVFLCAQCSDVFGTIEQCRDHMIKDHNMILSEELPAENLEASLPLKPIDTNSEKSNSELTTNQDGVINDEKVCNSATSVDPEPGNKASLENADQKKSKSSGRKKMQSLKADPDYDVRPFKCKHVSCVHRFRSNETLELHSACHQAPNRREYACSRCGDKFDEWRHCSLHLWNAHSIDVDLYTCGICGQHKATSRMNLETHMRIHRDVREFGCPECGKRFKQKAQLRNHRVTHIKKREFIIPDAVTPRWYMTKKCDICFKTYADSKCLKKHIQAVHSKLKPYVCHVCGHSSARKAMLQSHLRQHTGEKPYACPSCHFRTGDHNSLRRHMMRHSGERPYKCPHCPYASIQSTSFKNHLQIRHPGKEGAFSCVRCSFTTVSHSSFIQHLSDHKNNLIASDQSDVEVFPENVAAAQLIYQCLGAYPGDGSRFQADVTASSTSDDGTKQTITIEIPTNEVPTTDDEDTANCFLQSDDVDTGGITIPADPEPILVDFT